MMPFSAGINIQIKFKYILMDQAVIQHCKETLRKNHLDPIKKLGKGGFGIVFLVSQNNSQNSKTQYYSVKCTNKKQFVRQPALRRYIKQEISLLESLQHENIVHLVRTFQDDGWIFMVMEYCNIGNIANIQAEKRQGVFSYQETSDIISEVINGISYMHSQNIIHRDIKPENILQIKKKGKVITKICDLGFSRQAKDDVDTFCGTTYYMGPELFMKKKYNSKVDTWAIGVLIFSMLFGSVPFKSVNMEKQIINKCDKGYDLTNAKMKKNSSINGQNMLKLTEMFRKLFVINPQKRLGLNDILVYLGRQAPQPPLGLENNMRVQKNNLRNKKTLETENTESSSEEDKQITSFQIEKVNYIQTIVTEVREINFLNSKEFQAFKYYLDKICLELLQIQRHLGLDEDQERALSKLQQSVEKNFLILSENIKNCQIPSLQNIFQRKMVSSFNEYKEEYRIVVGHAFYKAHKCIDNIDLKMRTKLKIFCCHVINRVFEREYRKQTLGYYFDWVEKNYENSFFDLRLFKKWIETEKIRKVTETIQTINNKFYKKSGK